MEEIEESRSELATRYDSLPIGVMAMARDRRVTIWNRQMESWSGIARSSIVNRTLGELFSNFDDITYSTRLNDVFDMGAPVVLSAQLHGQVIPLSLPDGRDRTHRVTVVPVPGPDGARWALFALQDVTDLTAQIQSFRSFKKDSLVAANSAEAARQLAERQTEQLSELNRELDQFAYVASHDLQEPLRTLTSFSGFLQADLQGQIPEAAARDLEHIVAAAARMRRLIEGLLALSRVSRSEMSWSWTSLQACMTDALELLEHRVTNREPTIVGADTLPTVRGDRRLLTQLFQNLLSNAIKFADTSRPCVIHFSAEQDSAGWLIKTTDNGIGIPEQYLTKIFASFQRLHAADKYPGSGMGLAICKRVVERHGGTVWAVPNETVGTCFRFTLPHTHDQP
jgi:signal transduction histidine kinase